MRRFLAAGRKALACKLFDGFCVKAIAVAGFLLILATSSFSQSAFAQSECNCWKNSKTGQAVPGLPYGAEHNDLDPNRAYVPATGSNYYLDKASCTWKNGKTGQAVPGLPYGAEHNDLDPNRAYVPATGANYFRVVPCPPPTAATPPPPPTEKLWNVGVGYSHIYAPAETVTNLNGFNASVFYQFKPHLEFGGKVITGFGSTTEDVLGIPVDTSLHRLVSVFGPQFSFHPTNKVEVFVHPLFGVVHDSSTTTIGGMSISTSANAFAMEFGGGIGINLVTKRTMNIRFRPVEFNYTPTHFGGAWQNNVNIETGFVFAFGGAKAH